MSPKSHLFRRLFINGEYEPELAKLFLKYLDPSRDVIDIGANIGFFSVLAGRRLSTGRVLSVEPTDAAFARLSMNVQLTGVSDRAIFPQGLISDTQGTNADGTSVLDGSAGLLHFDLGWRRLNKQI